jgi:hypothetical protein
VVLVVVLAQPLPAQQPCKRMPMLSHRMLQLQQVLVKAVVQEA